MLQDHAAAMQRQATRQSEALAQQIEEAQKRAADEERLLRVQRETLAKQEVGADCAWRSVCRSPVGSHASFLCP